MAQELDIYLAQPRGFCSGVTRAILMVEQTLQEFGAPVYVLNQIVHNKHVVAELEQKGAVFVTDINQASADRPLIFSAHGVPKQVEEDCKKKGISFLDATCPLVKKVHQKVQKLDKEKSQIIVIGKEHHPEIVGVVGQANNWQNVQVINSVEEAKRLSFDRAAKTGFVTQTTLCVEDVNAIVEYLRGSFLTLEQMKNSDICYATTHRQNAVKKLVERADVVLIIGSKNSSNSNKLKEVALASGAQKAYLIDDASELDFSWFEDKSFACPISVKRIGISAGASAPEHLVLEVIEAFRVRYPKINIQVIK